MRLVVQRVKNCKVTVNSILISRIDSGLLAYLGVEREDNEGDLNYLVNKLLGLRVFNDFEGKMNLSVKDLEKSLMIISQFTICADTRKGNRPSYNNAEIPEIARTYYLKFLDKLRESGLDVQSGQFQENMEVCYINDGPVTILVDSRKIF